MKTVSASQIKSVKKFCRALLKEKISSDLVHHNWSATKKNLKILDKLATRLKSRQIDNDIATIATYFLYTGFTQDEEKVYEGSSTIAKRYLTEQSFDTEIVDKVIGCLRTKAERSNPTNVPEKLFFDMCTAYFGKKKLKNRLSAIWEERNFMREDKIDFLTTLEKKSDEIESHAYQTAAAKNLFTFKKNSNLNALKSKIEKERSKNNLSNNKTAMTMFKTALRNHIDLINIADKKAGIMISINAILMTVMIPILGSYIIDISRFIIPSIVLVVTCGTAVILATMATRPQVSSGNVKDEKLLKGERSLFYFGNFYKMQKEDYRSAVKDVIVRDITLENSIINDLYDMGIVLGIKYNRLRWCYLVFAIGMGLTLVTFMLSFVIFPEI